MTEKETIRKVRAEIFSLAKESISLEIMHTYMQLDMCLKSGDLQSEDMENIYFRMWKLNQRKEHVVYLTRLIRELMITEGLIVEDK